MRAVQVLWRRGCLPLCVKTKDVDEIVNTVATGRLLRRHQSGGYCCPRCFEIERKLKEKLRHSYFPR